ncbi:MAG: hypothetical protein IT329_22715 [Caldilineaceae bacterium]|nr:hypothetical protein [Caldilineaceae bacterium]
MIPQLYRPTDAEIAAVIGRGLAKHRTRPEVAGRMERAAAILTDWTIYAEVIPAHRHLCWRVPSTTKPHERHYLIPEASRGSYCTCPDYERGDWQRDPASGGVPDHRAPHIGVQPGAPRIGSQVWCKHRMAITAYVRILADKLAALLDTDTLDLCVLGKRTIVLADGAPLCDINPPTPGSVTFAWHYDAVSFATWLAGQTLPEPEELPSPAVWPPRLETGAATRPPGMAARIDAGAIPALAGDRISHLIPHRFHTVGRAYEPRGEHP